MKVTKLQSALLGVLGLGMIALCADQMHPSTASASGEGAAVDSGGPVEVVQQPPVAVATPAGKPAWLRLQELSQGAGVRGEVSDAFASLEQPTTVRVERADPFEARHELTGLMLSGSRPLAVINGQAVAVGQVVDGYRLVSIGRKSATFQSGNDRVTLSLRK